MTKAKTKPNKIHSRLNSLLRRNERILQPALIKWFDFALKQIRRDLARKFAKDMAADITAELTYWEEIEGNGVRAIKPPLLTIMGNGAQEAYKIAELAETFDVLNVDAVKLADKICAKLVTNVTEKTKEGISTYIRAGIKEGKSMPKIARELRPLVGLTKPQTESIMNYRKLLEDKDKFPKLTVPDIDHKVQRYADKTHRKRMQTIARTETARAQSEGYLLGIEDAGVEKVEFSATLSACEKCQSLNGTEYTIEEARGLIPVHPGCTCGWLPVITKKNIEQYNFNKLIQQGEIVSLKETPPGLGVTKLKVETKIKPVEPPEKTIVLQRYAAESMNQAFAMKISQGLRKTYVKKLTTRNFGEMENAVLAYDSFRTLALVDKQIIGAISFQWDEVFKIVYISHTGTLMSPKGTGAELVRTAVDIAYKGRWGMSLESTYEAIPFWKRLGFIQNKKVLYVFDADFKRVSQIRKALGVTGRVKKIEV